ncbi:hypothetical protein [Listeria grayi]|uniref:hypothetical protein n=1 Tax=Listeria grayi TaxID=1641 RepID=UPI00162412F5|nr:hypothetical protein [Listeria grayi]MBC1921615.1 hypothetical protein [Listeria grayi]
MQQLFDLDQVAILWFQEEAGNNHLLILDPADSTYPLSFTTKEAAFQHACMYAGDWYEKQLITITKTAVTADSYLKAAALCMQQLHMDHVDDFEVTTAFRQKIRTLTSHYLPK